MTKGQHETRSECTGKHCVLRAVRESCCKLA